VAWLDVVPKPIRSALERIGLDEHYFHTYSVITSQTIPFEHLAEPQYARPSAFLGGSCALCATLCVAGLSWSALWHLIDKAGGLAFVSIVVAWIEAYGIILVGSLCAIHVDMLTLLIFRVRSSFPITYGYRLRVLTYLWAWTMPLGVLLSALEVLGVKRMGTMGISDAMYVCYLPIWLRQYALLSVWYDLDVEKLTQWNWFGARVIITLCAVALSMSIVELVSSQHILVGGVGICAGVLAWRTLGFMIKQRRRAHAAEDVEMAVAEKLSTQGPNEVVE